MSVERWEYLRTGDLDHKAMDAYGRVGWELVAVVQPISGGYYPRVSLYWKRRVRQADQAA